MMKKNKIEIIAEAGLNHNGKVKNAIKLIDIAKSAKTDFIKFQLYKTTNFINKHYSHSKVNFREIFKRFEKREFNENQWKKIISYAKKKKIKIFFSIFDLYSLNLIKKLGIKIVKIPSGEINNFPLLKKVNDLKLKVILSTGMSSLKEIRSALKILKKCNVTLLYCVSEYPTTNPQLETINFFKKKFRKRIGFSDHTTDVITPALSVMAGASMIEKHFTYFKNQKIGDHSFSLDPTELITMVNYLRLAEKYKLGIKNEISKKEKNLQFFARKGIYINRSKQKNEKISMSDIDFLRPEGKLKVSELKNILNKKTKKIIRKHQVIQKSFFKK